MSRHNDSKSVVPQDPSLVDYLQKLTAAQQRFLAHRPYYNKDSECCQAIGISTQTPRQWRHDSPAFKLAYQLIIAKNEQAQLELARAMAREAMPLIIQREIELATKESSQLRDREVGVAQQARKSLRETAGLSQAEDSRPTIVFKDLSCVLEGDLNIKASKESKGSLAIKEAPEIVDGDYRSIESSDA